MVQIDKKDKVDDLTDAAKNMKLDGKGTGHDEKLIIALDFGTTFSGIAFCFANQRDPKVVSILEWPGAEGEYTPKIPTIIAYDEHDKSKFTWGASVDRTKDNIQGVKLLLDPDQERPLYLPTSTMKWDLKRLPKAPMEVAADFIGAMYKHALSEIAKEVPASYLSVCQKEFVLSVPAIWSDKAKDLTIKAARFAGIHPVTLIKEPEAAALYTMYALDNALQVGDAFVVCDAGGGTVDLISYEVTSIHPKLQLKELVTGTGGMAGSLGLNKRFNEALKDIIGEDEWSRLRTHKAFFHAEKQFDREVKKAFRGRDSEEYFINFPMANLDDDPENGLEMNCWRLTGTTLKKIFAPLINDIIRLVDHQVKSVQLARPGKPVNGIFLVGGFGSSQYLKACIQKEYQAIQVMQPNDAWAAIVKGAALSRLPREAKVVSIKSTRHYGVEVLEVWNDTRDAGMPSRSVRDGVKRCAIMWWYIHIGNDLKRDQKIKFPFLHDIPIDYKPENLVFRETLYEAADAEAPSHRSKGEKLKFNCSLTADCRNVDPSHFIKMTGKDGTQYYDVSFDLCVTLESAIMKFSMEINGKEMGGVYANYD